MQPDRETIFSLVYAPSIPRDAVTDEEFESVTTPRVEIETDDGDHAIYVFVNASDETDYHVVRETPVYDPRPVPVMIDDVLHYSFPVRYEYEHLVPAADDLSSACAKNMRDVMMFVASILPPYNA